MSPRTPRTPGKAETPAVAEVDLLSAVRQIWEEARAQATRTVNTAMVRANWLIGRQIVEAQQAGKSRAGYGEESPAYQMDALVGFPVLDGQGSHA